MKQPIFYLIIFIAHFSAIASSGEGNDDVKANSGCLYSKNKVDQNGSAVRIMEKELLLNHIGSDPSASEITGIDNSVAVYAHLANYNNSFMLYLRIEVLSIEAQKNYGDIYMGDKLMLKLNDGEVIHLESGKSEIGKASDVMTSYTIFFPVSEENLSKLRSMELVKVRIQWSNGYMDYEVDNNTFFIRQIACVE